MEEHLGYQKYARSDDVYDDNYRNGTKKKIFVLLMENLILRCRKIEIHLLNLELLRKGKKDISDIDQKIISMYARGLTTRQISDQIEELYGFDCSWRIYFNVTDKILQEIEDWQNRPLDDVYSILFIDAAPFFC